MEKLLSSPEASVCLVSCVQCCRDGWMALCHVVFSRRALTKAHTYSPDMLFVYCQLKCCETYSLLQPCSPKISEEPSVLEIVFFEST